jgi:DNA helicase-2/ATP-dependent DNA helicase PcrA
VNISPLLVDHFSAMSKTQRQIVEHIEGPLLVIAGPGSGKTFSLVLRTLNLLLLKKAIPRELIICTFTEKAAYELRDRISAAAQKVKYNGDLSDLNVTTIHGLCNRVLSTHRHRTPLGNNYQTLDDLTQQLFIFDNFNGIIGKQDDGKYLGKWKTKWTTINAVQGYFNKITEELVDSQEMLKNSDATIRSIGKAYVRYQHLLFETNHLDFAHQQKLVYDLLQEADAAKVITENIKYAMVDEYQDTNYIQEEILLKLTEKTGNLCIVGDEDQSLYRFRGATVRNLLEFPTRVPQSKKISLTTNYRSHKEIIKAYDHWMRSIDWSNPSGPPFRFNKTIHHDPDTTYPVYTALFKIWGKSAHDEGERFADFVVFLKKNNVIDDYSQIVLLLHSVRQDHSEPYLIALRDRGIPVFCPRARAYFDNKEVRLMTACFAIIFGYYGIGRGESTGEALAELGNYVDDCIKELGRKCASTHPLSKMLQKSVADIQGLGKGQSLDTRPADYFYRLLALEPFASLVKEENCARNLATLSQLLNTFQNYYHYTVVTYKNREHLRFHLFNSFFRLLHEGGINEYEDPDQPFPKGYVQVMTIHQAKGLEFPVVVVGSLDKQLSTQKQIDRDLQPYYHRPAFEPEDRITLFDRMRLHYVAFSRAEKILVLTSHEPPKDHFDTIWQDLPQWPYVKKDLLVSQRFVIKERMPVKRSFSFTGDLRIYETCPRQYQFFREYNFTPSRSAVIFFGLLVHQTIEEIHRLVIDGKLPTLSKTKIRELFERTFRFLALSDVRPIGEVAKEAAFVQVMNYFHQNKDEMQRVIETEVDVSVEKEGYILVGKVDLLMGGDGRLELLDFKTSPRPEDSPELLAGYERQLCTYAHILERRYGKRPDRLFLYWTSEENKKNALMEFAYHHELVEKAGHHFDDVVGKIKEKDFRIIKPPESNICKECDLRSLCMTDQPISFSEQKNGH